MVLPIEYIYILDCGQHHPALPQTSDRVHDFGVQNTIAMNSNGLFLIEASMTFKLEQTGEH